MTRRGQSSDQTLRILRWLIDRGAPASAGQISLSLNIHLSTVNGALRNNPEKFTAHPVPDAARNGLRFLWTAWEE